MTREKCEAGAWHLVRVPVDGWDGVSPGDVSCEIGAAYLSSPAPETFAVFRVDGGSETIFYFSPTASKECLRLILRHRGELCRKPPEDAALEAGDESVRDLFFARRH